MHRTYEGATCECSLKAIAAECGVPWPLTDPNPGEVCGEGEDPCCFGACQFPERALLGACTCLGHGGEGCGLVPNLNPDPNADCCAEENLACGTLLIASDKEFLIIVLAVLSVSS